MGLEVERIHLVVRLLALRLLGAGGALHEAPYNTRDINRSVTPPLSVSRNEHDFPDELHGSVGQSPSRRGSPCRLRLSTSGAPASFCAFFVHQAAAIDVNPNNEGTLQTKYITQCVLLRHSYLIAFA